MSNAKAASQPPDAIQRRIDLALRMLDLGAWVFPLQHNGKKPFVPKAKGGEGFLDAKPDPDLARTFLSNPGQLNYGVAFPTGSDIFVLDLDGGDREARPAWREDWQRQYDLYGPPGLTVIVRTPSGGRHAYYRWRADLYGPMPEGDEMLGWTVRKPWKGYLVGPGSTVNGLPYEWGGADYITDFPKAWAEAAAAEKTSRPKAAAAGSLRITVKGPGLVEIGSRHRYLRNQARYLVGIGLTGEALYGAVADLNRQLPQPKTEQEVRTAIGEAEAKFEPDEVTVGGERVTNTRPARIYAEDVELALPAVQPFPVAPEAGAFAGLAGEAIDSLSSVTSASRVGMLTTLLAAWGGLFGTRTTYHGDQTSIIFGVLIGETGRARKGTTTAAVWNALEKAIQGSDAAGRAFGPVATVPLSSARWDGLASGEALVRILNDAKAGAPAAPVYGLIVEEEFERLLRRMRSSDGYQSTLDVYLRQAFDARMLQHITASKTTKVQPPYGVSILGNVTRETLRQVMTPEMMRSGFANRFLWVPIQERDVEIAGAAPWEFAQGIGETLAAAQRMWSGGQFIPLDGDALDLLGEYAVHLRSLEGLSGAMAARLHVIASRVALIHASIERAASVGRAFVERSIALTEYARSGISWSFRGDVGDEDANALFSAVCGQFPDGLGTREARAIIPRSGRFVAARQLLIENHLIRVSNRPQTSQNSSGGRPSVVLLPTESEIFRPFSSGGGVGRGISATPPIRPQTSIPVQNDRPQTVHERPETPPPVVTPDSGPTTAAPWCHFQVDHQLKHRDVQTGDPWCEICTPRKDAAE